MRYDSSHVKIVQAFEKETLKPCIIKFSSTSAVSREASVYQSLRDSKLNFVSNEVVIVNYREPRAGGTIDKSVALMMPVFVSSLASVPKHVPEEVVHTRAATDILPALVHMHSLNIYHMDVKLENILVNEQGMWYLGDFGSCVSRATEHCQITAKK